MTPFPVGPLARIAGHTFLVFGTLSVFLLIPLTLTANRRAMHWLGGDWRSVQRLTYVLWGTTPYPPCLPVRAELDFLDAIAASVSLVLIRLLSGRRRWHRARERRDHRAMRVGAAVLLIGALRDRVHTAGLGTGNQRQCRVRTAATERLIDAGRWQANWRGSGDGGERHA